MVYTKYCENNEKLSSPQLMYVKRHRKTVEINACNEVIRKRSRLETSKHNQVLLFL